MERVGMRSAGCEARLRTGVVPEPCTQQAGAGLVFTASPEDAPLQDEVKALHVKLLSDLSRATLMSDRSPVPSAVCLSSQSLSKSSPDVMRVDCHRPVTRPVLASIFLLLF